MNLFFFNLFSNIFKFFYNLSWLFSLLLCRSFFPPLLNDPLLAATCLSERKWFDQEFLTICVGKKAKTPNWVLTGSGLCVYCTSVISLVFLVFSQYLSVDLTCSSFPSRSPFPQPLSSLTPAVCPCLVWFFPLTVLPSSSFLSLSLSILSSSCVIPPSLY